MTPAINTPSVASVALPRWKRIASAGQLIVALVATLAFLGYLLRSPAASTEPTEQRTAAPPEPVSLLGEGRIRIDPTSPLNAKFQVAEVVPVRITAPILRVTGTVVASLRPGHATPEDLALEAVASTALAASRPNTYWQFSTADILTLFTDWQRAKADIAFTRMQLTSSKALAEARLTAQKALVERLEKYVAAGTDAKKDLDVARADLIQVRMTGQKEIHEAEKASMNAIRDEASTAKQLQQAGLDPAMLSTVTSDVDIVMADVPEGFLGRAKSGQSCEAQFFGIPNTIFTGKVRSIAPVITKDRRSLRVLFTIDDLRDQLRPGMFAEIGLGTDPREALLAPAEGAIHIARNDYLLVETGEPGVWRIAQVELGELRNGKIEVHRGLQSGDRVLGQGAILLKPVIVKSLRSATEGSP
ncbi:MAG TPA: efflux RND transporter periplasmic adaptor subunit [Urbifossiella sp.]|jgi:hypothetical protein